MKEKRVTCSIRSEGLCVLFSSVRREKVLLSRASLYCLHCPWVYRNGSSTLPGIAVADPYDDRCRSLRQQQQQKHHTERLPSIYPCAEVVLHAAGLLWQLRMSFVGFAPFCERGVSGVVVCKVGVKFPLYVPLLHMFSMKNAKGRADRVCTLECPGKIQGYISSTQPWVDRTRPKHSTRILGKSSTVSNTLYNYQARSLSNT